MAVRADERFTKSNPCPVCGGHKEMPQKQGKRCNGYYNSNRELAYCARVTSPKETGGGADGTLYMHRLTGDCWCEQDHKAGPVAGVASVAIVPDWMPLVPVPDSAPSPKFWRQDGRKPSAHWAYCDGKGRPVMYRVRFDNEDGGKDVFPYTYCEGPEGKRKWSWKDIPGGRRPLYGLDLLAARPDAPALVVEGEKAADATRPLLPGSVVITWPGGTNNTAHVDWRPLAGRVVTFWPDADHPCENYPEGKGLWAAREAATRALAAGAAGVRIVALPDGLPDGWDLADLAKTDTPEWMTADLARQLVEDAPEWTPAASSEDQADKVVINDDQAGEAFDVAEDDQADEYQEAEEAQNAYGLVLAGAPYEIGPAGVKGTATGKPRVIAARPIWPAAIGRDLATGGTFVQLAWASSSGRTVKEWHPITALSDGGALKGLDDAPVSLGRLASLSDWLTDATGLLAEQYKQERVTSRLGWVENGGKRSLVVPGSDPGITFTGDSWSAAGTVEGWTEALKIVLGLGPAGFPALAVMGMCAASPLPRLIGKRNPILGLVFGSSRGKTTLARLGLSIWGDPKQLLIAADMSTPKGIQAKALRFSDLPVCLDELQRRIQEGDKRGRDAVADMVYMLANGVERVRSTRDGQATGGDYRYGSALYTSEIPLADALPTGAQFRTIELHDAPLPEDDGSLSARLQAIADANRGAVARLLAEKITKAEADIPAIVAGMAAELRQAHPDLKGDDPYAIALVAFGLGLLSLATGVTIPCDDVKVWLAGKASGARRNTPDAAQAAFEAVLGVVGSGVWSESVFYHQSQAVAWKHPDGELSINPQSDLIRNALRQHGGDRHATAWAERGWLKKATKGTQIASRVPRGEVTKAWRVTTLGLSSYTGSYTEEPHRESA